MFYLVITSLLWAFSYSLIKANLNTLDPNVVTLLRMLCAGLIFLPFLQLKALSRAYALRFFWIGALQYGVMYLCFLHSFQYLAAYQIALFTTLTPVYIIMIHAIFAKKIHPMHLNIAVLAVIGGAVLWFKAGAAPHFWRGCLWVQASDLCFAYGQVAYQRLRQQTPTVRDAHVYSLLCLGAVVVAAVATTWSAGWSSILTISASQGRVIVYLGVIASGLGFFWWNKGAALTSTTTLAVFNNVKAPLAVVVALIFFKESADIPRLVLGLIILGAALWGAEYSARQLAAQKRCVIG